MENTDLSGDPISENARKPLINFQYTGLRESPSQSEKPNSPAVGQASIAVTKPAEIGDVHTLAQMARMAEVSTPLTAIDLSESLAFNSTTQNTTTQAFGPTNAQPAATLQMIVQAASALRDRPIELTLHPAELGRVRLTMHTGENSMAVVVSVERPETLDLLRRHIDQLASQLRDIGYQKLSFEYAGQGQNFGDSNDPGTDFNHSPNGEDAGQRDSASDLLEPLKLSIDADAGLDIRL